MGDWLGNMQDSILEFHRSAADAARMLVSADDVLVAAHIDADGISAAAVASKTLDRLGKRHTVRFFKKLSDESISEINGDRSSVVWLVDLGSGYLSKMKRSGVVIADHHTPEQKWRRGQTFLDDFENICHVNPHPHGIDGSQEICGAGVAYVIATEIDPKNKDLAYLAVIGASGDFQDSYSSKFTGYNRLILADAVEVGDVLVENDIRLFGRETRSLTQFLQFCTDPSLPGLTGEPSKCTAFLTECGIRLKNRDRWKTWNDLTPDEKQKVISELRARITASGGSADKLTGETYTLPRFERGSELRDAKEFATLLNSCGRYDDAETGLRICLGDSTAIKEASSNRNEHRRQISSALAYVKQNRLVIERRYLQYFMSGSEIRETIVGIAAGMLLGNDGIRRDIPIFAFADADDGVKVSARADRDLVNRGLDLSEVMKRSSELVGGYGGGHSVAAGATIPPGKEDDFLDIAEAIISAQLI